MRLKQAFQIPPVAGVRLLKDLIVEVFVLVEAQLPGFNTAPYRARLMQQRQVMYLNFIGDEGEDRVVAGFGRENYARLSRVKAQYDPENVFHLNHNIKPT